MNDGTGVDPDNERCDSCGHRYVVDCGCLCCFIPQELLDVFLGDVTNWRPTGLIQQEES